MPNYPYDPLTTPLDTTNLERLNENYDAIQADIASVASSTTVAINEIEASTTAALTTQRGEYTGRLDAQRDEYTEGLASQQAEYTSRLNAQNLDYNSKLDNQKLDYDSKIVQQKIRVDNIVQEITDETKASIVDSAKVNWLSPVDNFAALATEYPSPNEGDAAQTLDDDKIYRYDGTMWVFFQEFGQGPTTAIINQVNAIPLDQTKIEGQRNFHEFHKLHKYEGGDMQYSIKADRFFDFMIPIDLDERMNIVFQKDPNDDFIKLRNFSVFGFLDTATFLTYGSVTTGTMVTTSGANHYTTTVGTTVTTNFTGTGIDMYHFFDTRGGLWRAEVNGSFVKNISTHIDAVPTGEISNPSPSNYARRPIISGLAQGTHELKLIYQGADPAYPPTSSGSPTTARGWIRYNLSPTEAAPTSFQLYGVSLQSKETLLNNSSNKEFAFNVKLQGSSDMGQWFPEHNGIGTAFVGTGSQKLYIDGVEITSYAPTSYTNFKSAKLVQIMDMIHPNVVQPLARMSMVTTINRDGVHIDTTFDFIQNTQIAAGYINMVPAEGTFARNFTTAIGTNFASTLADDSFDDLNEGDRSFSYMVTGASDRSEYYAGMIHRNVSETMRFDQAGRRNGNLQVGATWLQHRANGLQKLYPQVFSDNYVMPAGSTYRFSGSFFAGKVQTARKLITAL